MTYDPENIFIGTAGWTIPAGAKAAFPPEGTHLERYGKVFRGVEINSSFHRPHRRSTYERWSDAVPDRFRFSVKAPKEITHHRRLKDTEPVLDSFLAEASGLGHKLGPLLFQLPPSFAFDPATAERFLVALRDRVAGAVTFEPRHASWFASEADHLLSVFRIARAAADPPPAPGALEPGGWPGLLYYRLHGSPQIYRSTYDAAVIQSVVETLHPDEDADTESWCIFDNTASGAATLNALTALSLLGGGQ